MVVFISELQGFLWTFVATLRDVLPIAIIIFGFQFFVIRKPVTNLKKVLIGFLYVVIGLALFLEGLDKALFPLGKLMAEQLTAPEFTGVLRDAVEPVSWGNYLWVYAFALCIGFGTTIAEPSLLAVAMKANAVSGGTISVWGLRITVAMGVSVGLALGSWRIVSGYPLHYFIIAGYIVVVMQTLRAPKMIIPLAYDTGGVTTSTVTVPLVAALGLGLAENVPGRSVLLDGFGLIAFACLFPIISVLIYAELSEYVAQRKTEEE